MEAAASTTGSGHSAAVLRARADDLRRFAARIRAMEVLDLHRFCGASTWVGPSQQRFEQDLRAASLRLRRAADELVQSATSLEHRADDLGRSGLPDAGGVR